MNMRRKIYVDAPTIYFLGFCSGFCSSIAVNNNIISRFHKEVTMENQTDAMLEDTFVKE